MPAAATPWTDIAAPLLLALVGGGVAAFWPWLQTHWRGIKFERIIRRELEELMPVPLLPQPNTPWWDHLRKRFVHEAVFARGQISANREFLLSLDPTVVYGVNQLWTAFENRDASQWLYFMKLLSHDDRVGSRGLQDAYAAWRRLLGGEATVGSTAPRASESAGSQPEALLDSRLVAFASLLPLTRYGSREQPLVLPLPERQARAGALMDWFYDGGGLLLSAEAFVAFREAQARLTDSGWRDVERWRAFSSLRTELKIDLGVHHTDVRHVELSTISRPGGPLPDPRP